ncbi:MAG: hypothetical protein AAF612_08105 [Planctomycetota bacterium]
MSTTLEQKLRNAGRRLQWTAGLAAGLIVTAGLVAVLILVVGLDAVLALPPLGLIALNGLLAAAILGGLIYAARRWRSHRYRPRWVARRIEERTEMTDNRLINALDLTNSAPIHAAPNSPLRRAVLERGEAAAADLKPGMAVDRRPLVIGGRYAILAAVLLGGFYLAIPSLFHAVLPRLAQPFADHPPFTLVQFDVEINPSGVIYGQPATIHATLRGPQPIEQAEVVFVDGDRRQPLPMTRQATAAAAVKAGFAATTARGEHQYALHLESAQNSREFYINTPHGRSKRYQLEVRPVPLFEHAEVTYRYPDYTGWPAVTQPLTARPVRVLVGTQLELTLGSNVALQSGTIRQAAANPGDARPATAELQPDPAQPHRATGVITVTQDAQYEIELIGYDGLRSPQPLSFEVLAVEDAAPDLYFNKPQARVVAPPHWTVDIEVVARDDIGMNRIELHRGVNGWGPNTVPLQLAPPGGTRSTAAASFDLQALGVQAGDVITYFAVGYDNHPTQPRFAETEVFAIQVVSREDWLEHRRMREGLREVRQRIDPLLERLEALRQERESLLDELADLEAQRASGEPLTPQQHAARAELSRRLQEYASQAESLAQAMEQMSQQAALYDFEREVQEHMRQAAEGLRQQQDVAGQLAEALGQPGQATPPGPGLSPPVTRMLEASEPWGDQTESPTEQVQNDLDRLSAASELVAEAERVRYVILEQRSLAQRMAVFRKVEKLDAAQQLRAAQLAQEQDQLRNELEAAQARLSELAVEHAEILPRMSAGAADLAERIESLRVLRDQESASRLAEAGEGRYAAIAAEDAADKLETLLSDCKNMGGDGASDLDGCLSLPRESWNQQLAQLAASQRLGMGSGRGSGYGMGGSMARMVVAGSPSGGEGDSDAQNSSGRPGGSGQGGQGADTDANAGAAQQVNPQQTRAATGIQRVLPGVPSRYREEAEAYFRRLADEADTP